MLLPEQRGAHLEQEEGAHVQEVDQEDPQHQPVLEGLAVVGHRDQLQRRIGRLLRDGFLQDEVGQQEVQQAQAGREPAHVGEPEVAHDQSTCRRTEDEAEPEGRTDQSQGPAPALGRRHIDQVGLRHGDVARGHAADHARDEQQHDALREAQQQVAQRVGHQRDQQHGPPADAVAEAAQEGRAQELHDAEERDGEAHPHLAAHQVTDVVGQDGDHQPEAQQVDEDREEEDQRHRAAAAWRAHAPAVSVLLRRT